MDVSDPQVVQALRAIVREEVRTALARLSGSGSGGESNVLSTRQAATFACVSTGTIRRWVREGRLEGIGAGRGLRVRREELEALVEGGRIRVGGGRSALVTPESRARAALGKLYGGRQ